MALNTAVLFALFNKLVIYLYCIHNNSDEPSGGVDTDWTRITIYINSTYRETALDERELHHVAQFYDTILHSS